MFGRLLPKEGRFFDLFNAHAAQTVRASHELKALMENYERHEGKFEAIVKTCEEIDRLESDADRVMRGAVSKLFREEKDVREVMKMHAIYQLLESITDRCLDVANLVEGISLENA